MREKYSLGIEAKEFSQRFPHLFRVFAILRGQKREAIRIEIDQRIADDERSPIGLVIKRNLTRWRAFDNDRFEFTANPKAVCDFYDVGQESLFGKLFRWAKSGTENRAV